MLVNEAKEVARGWVIAEASNTPGFYGAFFHGSINWLPDDAVLPATSDVDIMVVFADPPPNRPGKFLYRDLMLEVSYLPRDQVQTPEQVLGTYHMAGSFSTASVILDPSGHLTRLQTAVSEAYARHRWVRRRCEDARDKILRYVQTLDKSDPWHDQVTSWLFATGVTTHVLLVAGLQNPTVRRRYVAARRLLAGYDQLDFYETLLELLGCAHVSRERVETHLARLAELFDAAQTMVRTPFAFGADISEIARPIVLDGSREMIENGYHREAVFWMVATYCRCHKVLYHDAPPAMQERFRPDFRHLLADLGITSCMDLEQRCGQVESFLPRLWEVTEDILKANPDVER